MNNIKYRALAKDGTWRYGSYPCLDVDMGNTKYPMDIFWNNFLLSFRRETLGQWTGLLDKKCKEIYQGDILLMTYGRGAKNLGIVEFKPDYAQFILRYRSSGFACMCREIEARQDEVIGNIWENYDLLELK